MKTGIAIALILGASRVMACDCSLPSEYGNPVCAATITAALNAKPATTATSSSSAGAVSASSSNSTSKATGGSANAVGVGGTSNVNIGPLTATGGNQSQQQKQSQTAEGGTGGAASAQDTGNVQGVTQNYESSRIPVSTAYAPALTSGIDTCLGSESAGAQTGIFGISLGHTKRDKNCEFIKKAHLADQISPLAGCHYRIANDKGLAQALKDSGQTCESIWTQPAPAPVPVVVIQTPLPVAAVMPEQSPVLAPQTVIKPVIKHKKAAGKPAPVTACIQK